MAKTDWTAFWKLVAMTNCAALEKEITMEMMRSDRLEAEVLTCVACGRTVGKIYHPPVQREDGKPVIESYDDCTRYYPDRGLMTCACCQTYD